MPSFTTNKNDKIWWISQKLFYYQHINGSTTITITTDCSIVENEKDKSVNYNGMKVVITIRDSKVFNSIKNTIDLTFLEISDINSKIKELKKGDLDNLAKNNTCISTRRSYGKNSKSFVIELTAHPQLNNKLINLSIVDSINPNSNYVVSMDWNGFSSLSNLIDNLNVNFLLLNSNCIERCCQERKDEKDQERFSKLINSIEAINEGVKSKLISLNTPDTTHSIVEKEDKIVMPAPSAASNITDNIEPEIPEATNENYLQNNYDEFVDFTKEFEILNLENNKVGDINSSTYDKPVIIPATNNFVSSLIKNNLTNFRLLLPQLINTIKTSEVGFFDPLNYIMTICNINDSEIKEIQNSENYYKIQFYSVMYLKQGIKNYLKQGKIEKYPMIRYNYLIKRDTDLWSLMKYITTSYLIYNEYKIRLDKVTGIDDKLKMLDIQVWHLLRTLYLNLCFSSEILQIDEKELKNEFEQVFSELLGSGALNELESTYHNLTKGGYFNFKLTNFIEKFNVFYLFLKNNINKMSKTINEINEDFGLSKTIEIKNLDDVKAYISEILHWNDIEEKQKDKEDKRLKLFIECAKYLKLNNDYVDKLEKYGTTYNGILEDMKKFNMKDPGICKLKRVMDSNEKLNRKFEVLQEFENFMEQPNVSISRIFDMNNNVSNDPLDNPDILEKYLFTNDSMEDIFK